MRKYAILFLIVLISSSFFTVPSVEAQEYYYALDAQGNYVLCPGPFQPYWMTTYKGRKTKVKTATITISVEGFPSDFSTDLNVDGKSMGSLPGGGTSKFQIKGDDIHTFRADSYVSGKSGERFYCKGNSWTSEKGREIEVEEYREVYIPLYWWWGYYDYYWYAYYPYYIPETRTVIEPFDQAYTFKYEIEYELTVQDEFGGSASQAGWYAKDSTVTLSTKPVFQISENTRYVFEAWTLNGADTYSEQVTIKMDKPYSASARYEKQYYLEVRSDYGNPTGSDWYDEGSKAKAQVEKELPTEDIWGALGARRVFDHWSGDESSRNNPAEITMDSSKSIIANWKIDYTMPLIVIILLVLVIAVAIFARKRTTFRSFIERMRPKRPPKKPAETPIEILRRRLAEGEITPEEFEERRRLLQEK